VQLPLRVCVQSALIALAIVPGADAQYRFDTWTTENGLPQNSVHAIHQTRDGYLWLATFGGLVRFDGVSFTLFDGGGPNGPRSSRAHTLYEDRRGALWIGTEHGGVARYADGLFTSFTTRDGLPIDGVSYIQGDRQGRLWLATSEGLVRYQNGRFRTFTTRDGLPFNAISRIIEDRDGAIWFGTRGGLIRYRDDAFTAITTADGLPDTWVRTIRESTDGTLWVGTGFGGLARVRDGRVVAAYSMSDGLPSNKVNCLTIDRAGTLWVGTDKGLARFDGDSLSRTANVPSAPDAPLFTTYTRRDGLSDDNINTIFEDREGNLWIGTNTGGLNRLKPRKLIAFSREQGLPGDGVVPVTEDREGALWIGMTCGGLVRYRDGTFTSYGIKEGLRNDCVWSLLADRQGNVWFGTWGGGLTRFRDGTFTNWRKENSGLAGDAVLALYEDRAGVLWVGTGSGLHRFENGMFTVYRVRDGLVADDVRFITEDRAGALWIGTTGGVSRFTDGAFTSYTTAQGLAHNYVRAIHQTADGTMWFGTYGGGLDRFRDGRFTHYTARDGLFGNVVSRILEDDRGNFWMTGNKGIFRVARQDLEDFADRKRSAITSVPYGVADGMVNSECNGGGQPAGWKRRDGTLWFPTARGVVRVDPAAVTSNAVPPPVAIERVLVDRTEMDPRGDIDIPSGRRDLEIHYTGLSYSAPEHVRFKYMLAGLDHGWTDAGTRRSVYYSHLPPGRYTFTVIAANGDGVWNTTGSHIQLRIVPAFYQTWWFVVFAVVATATLGFAVHDRRVQLLTRAKMAQEAFSRRLIESQEAERKRIAAELHDSLSQTLVVIKNRAALSLQTPDDHRRALDQLDEIAEAATDAIDEVKEIAYNLRPFHLDRLGLTAAIDVMLTKMADAHGLRVVKDLDPLDEVFPKDEEINIYRIVQEGLTNIVKHASATEVTVTIKRDARSVRIALEDNGRGFAREAPSAASSAGRAEGGFGLQGMAERARLFGGEPVVQSVPGQGTTIRLTLDVSESRGVRDQRERKRLKGDHGERRPDPARG
jgi:ligand-binding sensor domain-containing protein/signal transduction histidine kinase